MLVTVSYYCTPCPFLSHFLTLTTLDTDLITQTFFIFSLPPHLVLFWALSTLVNACLSVCVAGVGGTTEAESGGRQGEAGGCGPRQGPDPGAEQLRAGKCQRQTQAGERKCAVRELSGGRWGKSKCIVCQFCHNYVGLDRCRIGWNGGWVCKLGEPASW